MPSFLIKPHQGKERPYFEALLRGGWVQAQNPDVVFIDFEVPVPVGDYHHWVSFAKDVGAALCSYPHGFALVGEHQLTKQPYECAVSFVHGPGQKKLRELYDYPNPVEWVGYPGERKPLEPRECNHVLFAPQHPLGSGWMPEEAKRANTEAFRTLLDGPHQLSVRLIGSLEQNGIWEEPGVRYIYGQMDGSVEEDVDVAVAGGTYAANCLAKGIPVVMYDQERSWRVELEGNPSKMVPDWQKYENYTRYPYDLDAEACEMAAQNYPNAVAVQEWMDRFMPPFDAEKFVKATEAVCSPVS